MTGRTRFNFDNFSLSAGLTVIPLLIGFFALSEVLYQAATLKDVKLPAVAGGGFKVPPWSEWRPCPVTLLRSCGIGSFIGVLPGTGATAELLVSYADPKRRAPNPEEFGKGEPSGLIASESSNNVVSGRVAVVRRLSPRAGASVSVMTCVSSPPLIKPDMRVSCIRLSDGIMPSTTEGSWSSDQGE